MKRTTALIITAVVFAGWTLYNLITGISGLAKSGISPLSGSLGNKDRCEVTVSFAAEVYEIEHRLNGIIPTGSEHFYLAAAEDGTLPLLIKASPSWYEKNFDGDGMAKSPVTLMCEVGRFDSDSRHKLGELTRDLSLLGESVSAEKYLNANYRTMYVFRVAAGAAAVVAVAAVIVLLRLGVKSGGAAKAASIVLCVAGLFCLAELLFLDHL